MAATMNESEQLPSSLESSLAVVREWLDKITAASTNPDLDLRNLRAVLTQPARDRRAGSDPCQRPVLGERQISDQRRECVSQQPRDVLYDVDVRLQENLRV